MITRNLVLMVGPALGGLIVAWQGASLAFLFDAVTFLASAIILVARPFRYVARQSAPPLAAAAAGGGGAATLVAGAPGRARRWPGPASAHPRPLADGQDGLAGVMARPGLRFAFAFFAALTFVTAMQQPLVVVFVDEVLGSGDISLGLVVSAAGLGGILGAVLGGARLGERRRCRRDRADRGRRCLLVVFAFNRSSGWRPCSSPRSAPSARWRRSPWPPSCSTRRRMRRAGARSAGWALASARSRCVGVPRSARGRGAGGRGRPGALGCLRARRRGHRGDRAGARCRRGPELAIRRTAVRIRSIPCR